MAKATAPHAQPVNKPGNGGGAAAEAPATAPANPLQERLREAATLHQQGKLVEAEQICQSVLQQDSDNVDALHHLGLIRLQQGKAEEAIGLIERALAKQPNMPAAYNHLAIALSALRRHELALATF